MPNGKKFLGVHLMPEFHKQVKIRAAEREMSISQVVVCALAEYLDIDPALQDDDEIEIELSEDKTLVTLKGGD